MHKLVAQIIHMYLMRYFGGSTCIIRRGLFQNAEHRTPHVMEIGRLLLR